MRTTIDVDGPVLAELKRAAKKERKTLGALLSELLADARARRRQRTECPRSFTWNTSRGGTLVDLADKERLWELLDREQLGRPRT